MDTHPLEVDIAGKAESIKPVGRSVAQTKNMDNC